MRINVKGIEEMFVWLAAAFFVSLIISFTVGLVLVPALRKMKAGQSIREDGPVWHNKKQGTPTMGGIIFISGFSIVCVAAGFLEITNGMHFIIPVFGLLCAIIGFMDDFKKLRQKRNLGLSAKKKFAFQIIAAVAFVAVMRITGIITANLYIPFFGIVRQIPEIPYFVFAVIVVVGTLNGVNITDGVDGLATGVTIPVSVCYLLIAALWSDVSAGIAAAALTGGLVAFLFFNFHPAKVFMGDTGAHFIGGVICAVAFAMDMPLILLPLGIVYFIEALSDIIQISYFKITKGKRVFKMAPLHHHFEMSGWSEYKIFTVFTAVSAIFAVISYYGVYGRFN